MTQKEIPFLAFQQDNAQLAPPSLSNVSHETSQNPLDKPLQIESKLPASDPSSGRFVLHYNPERATFTGGIAASAQKNFGGFVWTVVFALAILLFGFCAGLGNLAVGAVLCLGIVFLAALELTRPTNLEFNSEGFRVHWLHNLFFYTGPWIDWDAVSAINYKEASVPGIENAECFEVTFEQRGRRLWFFELMCVPITAKCVQNKFTLRFLECGFFQEDDRLNFIRALKEYVPNDRINAKLLAYEQFGEVPTFTALWMNSLHGNSAGETNELKSGVLLADGRYKVVKRLGAGGQAVVYDAIETSSATACVLKEFVLPVRGGREIKRRAIHNIQREANLLKSFEHQSIVAYRDLFIEGERAYLVMERIFGETLRGLVERDGKLAPEKVVALSRQMCDLLEFLHSSRPPVIHRDFTPENLMLAEDGMLKLIDFNVAHRLESSSTRTVVGKHAYVPPEQFRGKPTELSDIYALGATMCFLLTGEDPEPITCSDLSSFPEIPPNLCEIVKRATDPEESNRFSSASSLAFALSRLNLDLLANE